MCKRPKINDRKGGGKEQKYAHWSRAPGLFIRHNSEIWMFLQKTVRLHQYGNEGDHPNSTEPGCQLVMEDVQ